ncbi:MAG: serine protease [Solirubrobacteraceae bacterium]|nr:serine protease [Solirubrobacteraceae bacterium]
MVGGHYLTRMVVIAMRRLRALAGPVVVCGAIAMLSAQASAAALPKAGSERIVVRFKHDVPALQRAAAMRAAGVRPAAQSVGGAAIVRARPGVSPRAAVRRLRAQRAVAWSERSLRAGPAEFVFNDSGVATAAADAGWSDVQWSLTGEFGIRAPAAWTQAAQAGGEGGRGVVIAVLDSGVAYSDRRPYRRSPDLSPKRFVRGYDFIDRDPYANDGFGHGTFVTSTIAATANNGYGTVGIAYAARIMPLRVLDDTGTGDAATIAQAIRFAVSRHADVVNLSLELSDVLPDGRRIARSLASSSAIRAALRVARSSGVFVVAAAGNRYSSDVPARRYGFLTFDVGGTTEHGCLGNYSNHGAGLDMVAPGGGSDAPLLDDARCRPAEPPGRDISAVTFREGHPRGFLIPPEFRGTSMAAPHVSGVAALVLSAGVIGRHPPPSELARRLMATARDLGAPGWDRVYGAGLLDGAAATAPDNPAT